MNTHAYTLETIGIGGNVVKSKSVAILAEMGTGKTLISIGIAGQLYLKDEIKKLLIVAPLSITRVWEEEFAKFADFEYQVKVLEGSSKKKNEELRNLFGNKLQVAIINYESCWRMEKEIAEWKPDMIICDESSKIKNPQAKQSKALHRLGKLSKHNIILTGTPVTNTPLDFFSQYKFLDENIFGGSYYSFRARYAVMGGYGNHQVVGYKNLQELTEKAHKIAFRITKKEALDLPEQVDTTRYVELEPTSRAIYNQVERDSYAELDKGEIVTRNVLTKLLRLSQITGGYITSDYTDMAEQISSAKINALEDIVDECIDANKKLVVFARFIPEIDAITKMLNKRKIKYALIRGDVKDRAGEVDKFQNDKETKIFIGQLQTTGMGLTLTASDTAVFYSLSYNFADYEQAKARIHRIGQKNTCTYIHLIAKNTIDEKVMEALSKKKNIADLVVDNWRSLFQKEK